MPCWESFKSRNWPLPCCDEEWGSLQLGKSHILFLHWFRHWSWNEGYIFETILVMKCYRSTAAGSGHTHSYMQCSCIYDLLSLHVWLPPFVFNLRLLYIMSRVEISRKTLSIEVMRITENYEFFKVLICKGSSSIISASYFLELVLFILHLVMHSKQY